MESTIGTGFVKFLLIITMCRLRKVFFSTWSSRRRMLQSRSLSKASMVLTEVDDDRGLCNLLDYEEKFP